MRYRYMSFLHSFILIALFSMALLLPPTAVRAEPIVRNFEADIIVYRRAGCPYCIKAEAYLKKNNISHELRDIEQNPAFRREYTNLGGRGVPLILIGDESHIMNGWNEANFQKRYQAFEQEMAGYEKNERVQGRQANGAQEKKQREKTDDVLVQKGQKTAAKRQEKQPLVASKANDDDDYDDDEEDDDDFYDWGFGTKLLGKKPGIIVYRTSDDDAQKLVQLRKNDVVISAGKNENGMLKVTTTNGVGWVDPSLLEEVE